MATEVASLYATVGMDSKGFDAGQKKITSGLGGIGASFKSMLPAIGIAAAVAGGIAVVSKAVGFLGESVKMAAEEQAGMIKLGMAIENTGVSYDEAQDKVEAFLAAETKRAALDDGVGRESLVALTTATGDYTEAMKLLPMAQDLAAGTGMDVVTASKLLGKVAQGNTAILARYGIVMKKGSTVAQTYAEIMKRFGGQAAAWAKSTEGQQAKLNIALGNIKETLGGAFLPVLAQVAGGISDFITDNLPALEDFMGKVSGAIQKATAVIGKLWDAFTRTPGDFGAKLTAAILEGANMIGGTDLVNKVANIIGVGRALSASLSQGDWAGAWGIVSEQIIAGFNSVWPKIQAAWEGTSGEGLSMEGVEFDFGTVGLKEKIVAEWGKVFGEGGLADEIELWIKKIPGWIYDQLLTISVSLEPLTQKLKEWAENPENQEKLVQTAFAVTNAIIDAIKTFIGADNTAMDSLPTALQTSVDKNAARLTLVGMSIGKEIAKGIVAAIAQAWLPVYQKFIGTGIQTGTAVSGAGGGGGVRARAMGGDEWVTRPTLFLAGERGPERVTVTPQGKASGGNTINITINAPGGDPRKVQRAVLSGLAAAGVKP